MGNYIETAKNIVKESIKSAVYIDEKAREPFAREEKNMESQLSKELYVAFRRQEVSLSIYRYKNYDEYKKNKGYLFKKRDLAILDWKLDGESGEFDALNILSDIVNNQPNIHFCVIYTKEKNAGIDNVYDNIMSFFSGFSKSELDYLAESLSDYQELFNQEKIKNQLGIISRYQFENKALIAVEQFKQNFDEKGINAIRAASKCKDEISSFLKTYYAFSSYIKSNDKQNNGPTALSFDTKYVVINNTVILLLNKEAVKPQKLIQKYAEIICQNNDSFLQLLGVEMQNILLRKSSFIPQILISGSKDIFSYYKRKTEMSDDGVFNEFVKSILLSNVKDSIADDELTIVSALPKKNKKKISDQDFININTFIDSNIITNKQKLSFGDVFSDGNSYYICITALCDCANNKKNHYFVIGNKIDLKTACALGEGGFISYISNDIINWATVSDQNKQIEKFKPTYVKPVTMFVPDLQFQQKNDKKILVAKKYQTKKDTLEDVRLTYITTLKSNYAQRIANHAFAYPVRVGVDFVKK